MNEEHTRITEGLKKAIEGEIDGYHFYMMAARNTQDDKGKEVFEKLAQDEMEHVRFLGLQYESFLQKGAPDTEAVLADRVDLTDPSPIFSEKIRSRLGKAHYEMSALSIGIQLELAAVGFYKDQAEQSADETVRKFYTELSRWESGHYHALLRQQEALKEEYWAKGGFTPF